jgi:hypothetical protein
MKIHADILEPMGRQVIVIIVAWSGALEKIYIRQSSTLVKTMVIRRPALLQTEISQVWG